MRQLAQIGAFTGTWSHLIKVTLLDISAPAACSFLQQYFSCEFLKHVRSIYLGWRRLNSQHEQVRRTCLRNWQLQCYCSQHKQIRKTAWLFMLVSLHEAIGLVYVKLRNVSGHFRDNVRAYLKWACSRVGWDQLTTVCTDTNDKLF